MIFLKTQANYIIFTKTLFRIMTTLIHPEGRGPYGFYCRIVICLCILMSLYTFPDSLDIIRYYDKVRDDATAYNIKDYIKYCIETNIDFIYFTSLFSACKIGIHLNVITIFYLALYYVCCCEIIRKKIGLQRMPKVVLICALSCAPFVWVQEISRNLAAISFLYLAINKYYDRKFKSAIFFVVVSIFTHISMIVYMPILFVAYYLSGRQNGINRKSVTIIFLVLIIIGVNMPTSIVSLMSAITMGSDLRYSYYSIMENMPPLLNSSIGYGDKIPMVYIFLFAMYLILINRKQDFYYWMLYMLTGMLAFALFSSTMLTNRIIMLLPLFIAGNICSVLTELPNKTKNIYLLSIIGILVNGLHFYSYRTLFGLG